MRRSQSWAARGRAHHRAPTAGAAVLLVAAGTALGQEAGSEGLLRGPKVEAEDRGDRGSRLGGSDARDRAREAGPQPRIVLRVIGALAGRRAPQEVRLSEDQTAQVGEIVERYSRELRAHFEEHRAHIERLIEQAGLDQHAAQMMLGDLDGARDRTERRPAARDKSRAERRRAMLERRRASGSDDGRIDEGRTIRPETMTAEQRAALRELLAIREAGPDFAPHQKELEEILTPEQERWVRQRLNQVRRIQRMRMERDARDARETDAMTLAPEERSEGEPGPGAHDLPRPLRSARLAELLERLDAREQERLAEMVERYLERRRRAHPQPPSMDEIEIPDPS